MDKKKERRRRRKRRNRRNRRRRWRNWRMCLKITPKKLPYFSIDNVACVNFIDLIKCFGQLDYSQ